MTRSIRLAALIGATLIGTALAVTPAFAQDRSGSTAIPTAAPSVAHNQALSEARADRFAQ